MLHAVFKRLRHFLDGNFVLRRKALRRLSLYFQGDFLELGVGQGPDADFFRALPSIRAYTACDREEFHDTYTKGDVPRQAIVYYCGERLPFADASYESAVSIDCLEHIAPGEIPGYLKEAHRVLRPGGHLTLTAPFVYPEHCAPFDYQRFSSYGLKQLLVDAGFQLVRVTGRSSAFETLVFMIAHRQFTTCFPSFMAKEFVEPSTVGWLSDTVKLLALPLTAPIYILLILSIHASCACFPGSRERTPLSLGYVVVGKKRA